MSEEIKILAKLNAMLIIKHGDLFNIEGKAPSWEWVIKKLDGLLSHISTLKEQLKELQEERDGYKNGQIQLQAMVDDLMDVNAKWAEKVKELTSELSKWKAPHEDIELQEMKDQSEQSSLSAKQAYINALEWRVKHLEQTEF